MNSIAFALPEITAEVDKMKRIVETNVLQIMQSGKLTPEVALNKWYEWAAAHRLAQRFQTQVKVEEK